MVYGHFFCEGPTICLLYESTVGVDAPSSLGLLLPQAQHVLQAVQRHLHDLRVHQGQQVTQRAYAAQAHQVPAGEDREDDAVGRSQMEESVGIDLPDDLLNTRIFNRQ